MSLAMRKPGFCICENKDADQRDQRLCFRYVDSDVTHVIDTNCDVRYSICIRIHIDLTILSALL